MTDDDDALTVAYLLGVTHGRDDERAKTVVWLRSQGGHHDDIYEEAADDIEAGKHHGAPPK
jgi:hypothetical protein